MCYGFTDKDRKFHQDTADEAVRKSANEATEAAAARQREAMESAFSNFIRKLQVMAPGRQSKQEEPTR